MKKLLILIACLLTFSFAQNCKAFNGITYCKDKHGHWYKIAALYDSYDLSKYDYDTNGDEVKFWRQDGTLLFEGKARFEECLEGDCEPLVSLDGFCYDKTGLNKTKRTRKLSACK